MKKLLSVILSLTMLFGVTAGVGTAYAAVPAASVSKLTGGSKAFTVKINKADGVSGYQIAYATNKSFKNKKTVKTEKAKFTVKKLKTAKTYYVKVRSYKKSGEKTEYSKWSSAKKVQTRAALGKIKGLKETAIDFNDAFGRVYSFEKVSGADGYQIKYVWYEGNFYETVKGGDSTKLWWGGQEGPKKIYIRAYKNGKNGREYGYWKLMYNMDKKVKTKYTFNSMSDFYKKFSDYKELNIYTGMF